MKWNNMQESIQAFAIKYIETKSEESFTKLYKRITPNLRNYIFNFLNRSSKTKSNIDHCVDDILSRVFEKVLTNLDQYNKLWNFSTWVYAICKNELLIEQTNNYKFVSIDEIHERTAERSSVEKFLNYFATNKDDLFETIDKELEAQEKEEYICSLYDMALDEMIMLPDLYKDILIDREINNMKYEELANKYNLPINTVKSRIKVGRSKIKRNILLKTRTKDVVI